MAITESGVAAEALVAAKLGWLRQQPLVRSELFCFFSRCDGNGPLDRGVLGERLLFKAVRRLEKEVRAARLKALASLRDQLLGGPGPGGSAGSPTGPLAGTYARLLTAPSTLREDSRLLTFEMSAIGKDPLLKRIALAAVMGAVTAPAATRRNRTVCAIDEAHDNLGDSPAADAFLGKAYAKMRKFDVAMWAVSQKFEDFQRSRAAPTIIGNSFLKLFLWHSSGWEVVERALGWPPSVAEAFRGLERVPFRCTDFLLFYGQKVAVVRHAPLLAPDDGWRGPTLAGADARAPPGAKRAGAAPGARGEVPERDCAEPGARGVLKRLSRELGWVGGIRGWRSFARTASPPP